MKTLIFIFSLLVALPAWGTVSTDWQSTPGGTAVGGCLFLTYESSSCFWDSISDEDTDSLNISMCENLTASFFHDSKNSLFDGGNTAAIRVHTTAAIDNFNDSVLVAGKTLTGNPDGDLFALYGFDGEYITVDLDCSNVIGAGVCRVQVQCHPRKS